MLVGWIGYRVWSLVVAMCGNCVEVGGKDGGGGGQW